MNQHLMRMKNEEFNELFRKRTLEFGLRILKFIDSVPVTPATKVMTYQLGKAGSSIGANWRAFCRGRSRNERYAKICIVVEEADESQYWLEIFKRIKYGDTQLVDELLNEALEIVKVTTSIKKNFSQSDGWKKQ